MAINPRDTSGSDDGTMSRREFSRRLGAAAVGGAVLATPDVAGPPGELSPEPAVALPAAADDLCFMPATELLTLLRGKQVSAREVMTAHLARIERVNPKVNAIVTLVAEQAMAGAPKADEAIMRARSDRRAARPADGAQGSRRYSGHSDDAGSPFYRDNVPSRDALIVTRMRAAGAITVGKTNTPEFGAGSQTFNPVFGATRNPYDVTKTCGGSSGGAAAAVAARMVPIADGSDTGGSLRNPPAFCNVVGLTAIARARGQRIHVVVAAVGVRTDGANSRRCRAVSERHCGTGSSESAVDQGRSGALPIAARKGLQGRAGRLVARPWRDSLRTRDPPGRGRQSQRVREPRLRRRGGRAGLHAASTKRFRCFATRPTMPGMRRSSGSGPSG